MTPPLDGDPAKNLPPPLTRHSQAWATHRGHGTELTRKLSVPSLVEERESSEEINTITLCDLIVNWIRKEQKTETESPDLLQGRGRRFWGPRRSVPAQRAQECTGVLQNIPTVP